MDVLEVEIEPGRLSRKGAIKRSGRRSTSVSV